jgi:hypothetical protein
VKYETVSLVHDEDFNGIADDAVRCKFVIIAGPEASSLVFGPLSRYSYHADLVEKFCADRLVKTKRVGKGDVVEILDPALSILGGGYLTWSRGAQSLRIGGSSKAYGPCNLAGLQAILDSSSTFTGFKIAIEQ